MSLRLLLTTIAFSTCTLLSAQTEVILLTEDRQIEKEEYANYLPDTLDFFHRSEPLKITLKSDFRNLTRRKMKNEYQEALLTFSIGDTIKVQQSLRIKPRGNYRLQNCDYAPIMLNFKKGEVPIKNLKNWNKIKLVNKCKEGGHYQDYLLKEFLVYKLYNQLTEKSFQACLLHIDFVDTGRDDKVRTDYGFIIESGDAMEARTGLRYLDNRGVLPENTDPYHAAELALFQYMIGNSDWSIKGKHNVKLLAGQDLANKELFAVPYDFDYCGFVNAVYAIPPDFLPIKSVTDRIYRSYCSSEEEFNQAFEKFRAKKDDFYATVHNFTPLEEKERDKIIRFLDGFYEVINNPKLVKATIMKECRPRESSKK